MKTWSPYQIRIILHAYAIGTPWEESPDAPIYRETIELLKTRNLLTENQDKTLSVTDKGKALVGMICSTPMPVSMWVDPRFDRLSDAGSRDEAS